MAGDGGGTNGQSIFEAQHGGDATALLEQRIKQGSQAVNKGTNFFANDPYNQYKVYLGGSASAIPQGMPYGQARMYGYTDKQIHPMTSYSEAVLAPTTWSEKQLREFVNKGLVNKVPGFEVGMGMPQIQAAWQGMVQASILFNQGNKKGDKPWSPMDVLDTYGSQKGKYGTIRQGDWVFDVATGERIKYVGPTSKTTTSKQVDLSSPEEAQALVTQILQQAIGRAPTAKELAQFKSTITGYEKANPEVTTTVQQLSPNMATGDVDVTSQSSTTSGGVSDAARAALVQDPTLKTKEYGKYQAATTYFNAMMQMIGGS